MSCLNTERNPQKVKHARGNQFGLWCILWISRSPSYLAGDRIDQVFRLMRTVCDFVPWLSSTILCIKPFYTVNIGPFQFCVSLKCVSQGCLCCFSHFGAFVIGRQAPFCFLLKSRADAGPSSPIWNKACLRRDYFFWSVGDTDFHSVSRAQLHYETYWRDRRTIRGAAYTQGRGKTAVFPSSTPTPWKSCTATAFEKSVSIKHILQ